MNTTLRMGGTRCTILNAMRERRVHRPTFRLAAFGLTVLCAACGSSAAASKPTAGHGASSGSRAAIDGGLHAVNGNAGGSSGSADVGSSHSGLSDGGTAGGNGASGSGGSSNVGSGGVGGIGASGGIGGGRGGASGSAGAGPVTGGADPTMLPTANKQV